MTAADETATLAVQPVQGYRERKAADARPKIVAVPGRVLAADIEGQADALADDAARLASLLTEFAQESGQRFLDSIAVFRQLDQAAESIRAAAAELRRQGWAIPEDGAEPAGTS